MRKRAGISCLGGASRARPSQQDLHPRFSPHSCLLLTALTLQVAAYLQPSARHDGETGHLIHNSGPVSNQPNTGQPA
ncbi:hypothetical protein HispidOSU_015702 [Sigmodon hispidus]